MIQLFAALVALAAVAPTSTPAPMNGPEGWIVKSGPHDRVVGLWASPTVDTDLVNPTRAILSVLSVESTIDAEERSRDNQIAQLAGTLERDRAVKCGPSEGRYLEYVLTKPSTIDNVVLMIQTTPDHLLLVTYSRPVGSNVDAPVAAWFQKICSAATLSTI